MHLIKERLGIEKCLEKRRTKVKNEIFKCKNCNIRMTPITVEVDY